MITRDEVQDALRWVSADCGRDEWWRVLAAVKAALGEHGQDLARDWSAGGASFDAGAFRDTWRSLRTDGGIGPASLFRAARDAGWLGSTTTPPPRLPQKPQTHRDVPSDTTPYALAIWARVNRDDAAVAGHPYALRKGIRHAAGAGRTTASGRVIGHEADCIAVPLRTLGHQIVGVELINPEGKKQTFGRKGILLLGNDLDKTLPLLVCEGWACGVGLFRAYDGNVMVVCAFSKSRLRQVAEQLQVRHPGRTITLCMEADA